MASKSFELGGSDFDWLLVEWLCEKIGKKVEEVKEKKMLYQCIVKKVEELRRDYGADIHLMKNPVLDISSTEIKDRIRRGEDISSLVPACVKEYIDEHGLYRQ